jgi:hypothetical protein
MVEQQQIMYTPSPRVLVGVEKGTGEDFASKPAVSTVITYVPGTVVVLMSDLKLECQHRITK